MKICFLGAGALGSAIGGTLAQNGEDVYLVDQWQEHVNAINNDGLIFNIDGKEVSIPVKATTNSTDFGPMDLVIVLVKSFATETAIKEATNLIGKDTVVMSLQNGLGNEETIEKVVGPECMIGGKAYVGGVLTAPGHITPGVKGKEIVIGEMNGEETDRINNIATELTNAGVTTLISLNIKGLIWNKLLINVATGALAAITKLPYGELYQQPEIEKTALAAVQEGIDIAQANNIKLTNTDPKYFWDKAAVDLPYGFKTSMLQSLEKHQQTEVDFINGALVRWGAKSNIPTPVNSTLLACVKGIERWQSNVEGN